jgi:hypothetical protein
MKMKQFEALRRDLNSREVVVETSVIFLLHGDTSEKEPFFSLSLARSVSMAVWNFLRFYKLEQ